MQRHKTTTTVPAKLDSPAKRQRIAPRRNPHWVSCGAARGGLSLGYRKPNQGAGAWIARLIRGGRRAENRLGEADDEGSKVGSLTYAQAVAAAMAWGTGQLEAAAQAAIRGADCPTIRSAVADYVAERKKRHPGHGRNAETRLAKWLLADDALARKSLAEIVEGDLSGWAKAVAASSPATIGRLLNDVRAALNRAHEIHHRLLPAGWRDVVARGLRRPAVSAPAPGPAVLARRLVIDDTDLRALVAAAQQHPDGGDFGRLVAVLAATGARFSQIARLLVSDVVAGQAPRILVPGSRKGRDPSRKATHTPVPVGGDLIAILQPALAGRRGDEPLLMRWRMRTVAEEGAKGRWERGKRVVWANAYEMVPHWRATIARAGLNSELQPYRLRDASIIRGLRAGQPVRLVAAQHDTSVAMIEKHYAQHISDALSDLARKGVIALV